MQTVSDLIAAFGGISSFARAVGCTPSAANEMKRTRRIAVDHWPSIMRAAGEMGIAGVDEALLLRIQDLRKRMVANGEGDASALVNPGFLVGGDRTEHNDRERVDE